MIKQNTVIILGAGASKHYGYPTGEDLRSKIISFFESWYTKHLTPFDSYDEWSKILNIRKNEELRNIREFIKDYDKSGSQIDLFITRNSHSEVYAKLGKLAIILGIIESEKISFFKNGKNDWYRELFTQLTDDRTKPDNFRISQNNISFITFNYDRSLEYYLHRTLKSNFLSADESDIAEEINNITIIHVYGTVAPLDWQKADSNIQKLRYRMDNIPRDIIFDMSNNIYVMHGKKENPNVDQSKRILEKADYIYFLGFGFSRENMEILDLPNSIKNAKRIFGTAYGLPTPRIDSLILKYFNISYENVVTIKNDMKCNDLIYTYSLPTN